MMIEVAFDKMMHQIDDELDGAHKYVECAIVKKEDSPEMSDMYIRLAATEMEHAQMLHDATKKFLEKNDAPKELWAVWHWQNEKYLDRSAHIRAKMDAVRKG